VRAGLQTLADQYAATIDLLKNKSRPEAAAEGAPAWVISERELRAKLKKEREAKERELEKEVRPGLAFDGMELMLTRTISKGEGAGGRGETSGGREGENQD